MKERTQNRRPAAPARTQGQPAAGGRTLAPHVQAAVTAAAQPKMRGSSPSAPDKGTPPAHVQAALKHAVQAKPEPARGRGPAAPVPPVRTAIPPPSISWPAGTRVVQQRPSPRPAPSSIIQRAKQEYTASSVPKGSTSGTSNDTLTFLGQGGEALTVVDTGAKFEAFIGGGSVAYISYNEETEEGTRRMRFGYIHVTNSAHRNKKLSSLLICLLALKALNRNIMVICVGHPDPTLRNYWENIGFDYRAEQSRQYEHRKQLYKDQDIGSVDDVIVTEANAKTPAVLKWAQGSYSSYWKPQ